MEHTVTLSITDLAFGGDGVGRVENMVCFVPRTVPGDTVEVRITERKKRFLRGILLNILSPSPARIEAPCPYFGQCGGCQWQHVQYELQVKSKVEHLSKVLYKNGRIEFPAAAPIPSPEVYRYRRNGRMKVTSKGEIGFFGPQSRRIVPVQSCLVFEEVLDTALDSIRKEISRLHPRPSEVELISLDGKQVKYRFLFPGDYSKLGFLQANRWINRVLQDFIRQTVKKNGTGRGLVIDLYCGDGNLSLPLAEFGIRLLGLDISQPAIKRAEQKRKELGLTDFSYRHTAVQDSAKELLRHRGKVDTVICDPPRQGLEDMASVIASLGARTILYISCFPAVLAKDVQFFLSAGYNIRMIQPMDMFPQTFHLETAVVLSREGADLL